MNRIVFIKLPKIGRYFDDFREELVRGATNENRDDFVQIEEARSLSVSGSYFRRRITKYRDILETGGLAEVEREVIDIFSFRIDARQGLIELYNPPRSISPLMNRLSILSSGRLSYTIFNLDIISAIGIFRSKGDFRISSLRCKDLVVGDSKLVFTGRVVGSNLPESFVSFSGQDEKQIEAISGVFLEQGSKTPTKIELRKNGGVCTSETLNSSRRAFYRSLAKTCETIS